jgi:hypothetical protein
MKIIAFFCLLLLFNACEKEHTCVTQDDVFVFGTGYGFCAGDCAHLFQIRHGKLYADNIDNLYLDSVTFSKVALPDSMYQHARALPGLLPPYLMQHPNEVLGCPDCYDQGMIYVELWQKGKKTTWKMDTNTGALPPEVQPFAQQILNAMELLH